MCSRLDNSRIRKTATAQRPNSYITQASASRMGGFGDRYVTILAKGSGYEERFDGGGSKVLKLVEKELVMERA